MAGSAVVISENKYDGPLYRIKFAWTSDDAAGTVTSASTGNLTANTYSGFIVGCVTDPGSAAPTDNYDLTVVDDDGIDVLWGMGADRDTATTEFASSALLGVVVDSKLYITIANAGNSKTGDVYLYINSTPRS